MKQTLLCLFVLFQAALHAEDIQGLVLPFKQVSVSSPVDDIIKEIVVAEGDTVTLGHMLAQLANEAEQLEVQRMQKLIEKHTFDNKAAATLLKEKMMSQEEALTKAVELELARIGHATAEFRLSQKRITSPLSGIVVKKHKESGESVTRVDKLFDIVNIDKVYLQFYLDPVLMQRIQRDAKVKVVFPTLPDKEEFIAVVSFVDPVIDAGSGLFRVKLLMDNPGHRIKAGMRVEADFTRPAETAQ